MDIIYQILAWALLIGIFSIIVYIDRSGNKRLEEVTKSSKQPRH